MSYNATENSASRRIATLLDEGSFVEIGGAVTARSTTFNLQEKAAPSDGVITGYGVIDGNLVYVYSQDADVLGGALGEMHAKKIARIYDMAMKMGAPVIGLIDCCQRFGRHVHAGGGEHAQHARYQVHGRHGVDYPDSAGVPVHAAVLRQGHYAGGCQGVTREFRP